MQAQRPKLQKTRTGTAATEFAITAPLMMLVALATADMGRAFHYREAVSNAARIGAARAAARGFTDFTREAWESDIRAAVLAELGNLPDFKEADLQYELTVTSDGTEFYNAAVDLVYPFRNAIAWPTLPQVIPIHERVEMRRFR